MIMQAAEGTNETEGFHFITSLLTEFGAWKIMESQSMAQHT